MPVSAIDYVSGYLMAFGAMVALARRAREGGSWLVRVSLARTGKWLVDRGLLDGPAAVAAPAELPADEIERITQQSPSPLGLIRHLAPVARMSATAAALDATAGAARPRCAGVASAGTGRLNWPPVTRHVLA